MKNNLLAFRLICAAVAAALALPVLPAAPAAAYGSVSDAFGYTVPLDGIVADPEHWIEINGTGVKPGDKPGEKVDFSGVVDDALSEPIEFGNYFTFPFYESSYTSLKISTNGYITFDLDQTISYPNNSSLPAEFLPDGLIAGFWDDLLVGSEADTRVYILKSADWVVIEWDRVTSFTSNNSPITFQIVLLPDGNFRLIYKDVGDTPADATAGFEDADGIDGLVFTPVAGREFEATYPNGFDPGIKASPLYQGAFLANGAVEMQWTVYNTAVTAEALDPEYKFTVLPKPLPDGWTVEVNDGHNLSLPLHGSAQVTVRVTAPADAVPGDYLKGQIKFTNIRMASRTFLVDFQAAVPAPFNLLYSNTGAGYTRSILPERHVEQQIFSNRNLSGFGLSGLSRTRFVTAWTAASDSSVWKGVTLAAGGLAAPGNKLDSPAAGGVVSSPVPAAMAAGTAGLVYLRELSDGGDSVEFAHLDASGALLDGSAVVLNAVDDATTTDFDAPDLTASGSTRFVTTYEVNHLTSGADAKKSSTDVLVNVLDADSGAIIDVPFEIEAAQEEFYLNPVVAPLANDSVFLAYIHQLGETSEIRYRVISQVSGATPVFGGESTLAAEGSQLRVTAFPNGKLALAWIKPDKLGLGYRIFSAQGVLESSPADLSGASGWQMTNLSLSGEIGGKVVAAWLEWDGYSESYCLGYALINPAGEVVTPPMGFLRGSQLNTSRVGRGVALLDALQFAFLPMISKR